MDVRIGKFKTKDGMKLHYEHWSPSVHHGTIVLVHGLGDHCGRYAPFVNYFTKKGYRLFIYDQRGHGRSEGKRVFAEQFDIFLRDLFDYLRFSLNGSLLETPLFLVGHSFGGQMALNFLAEHPLLFRAACVSSPNIEITLPIPTWQDMMSRKVGRWWPTFKLKGLSRPEWLSHDPGVVQNFLQDPLVCDHVTVGMGREILENLEELFDLCPRIKTPLLLLHGSEDRYCSPSATERFFKELRLDQKRLNVYEGKYHELLNEVEKENVYKDIEDWFMAHADFKPARPGRQLPR